MTEKSTNPHAAEIVLQELTEIRTAAKSDTLKHLADRDMLTTFFNVWTYRRADPRDEVHRVLDRFEPVDGDQLENFYDHEVLARSFAIVGDDRADQHIEAATKLSIGLAGAFSPKLQRVLLTQAAFRQDERSMERLWPRNRRTAMPSDKYQHYARDMEALRTRNSGFRRCA
jgi:hypothetical protein